jgi:hypothetical protein
VGLFQAKRASLLQAEAGRRLARLAEQEAGCRQEEEVVQRKWQAVCQSLTGQVAPPRTLSVEAVRQAQAAWQEARQRQQERLIFARQWAEFLEGCGDLFAQRLPGYVNLVAATTTALAADEHFGEAPSNGTAGPVRFDLLVLEEADQVTESEFLKVARRARRWALVGEPMADSEGPAVRGPAPAPERKREPSRKPAALKPSRPASLRPGFFQRLWEHLHLPAIWVHEEGQLRCRLRPLPLEHRQWLQVERVADHPEIELRIVAPPRAQPALAEVVFPAGMAIGQAKQFIYKELEEVPARALGQSPCWSEEADRLVLRLPEGPGADAVPVLLEPGVRELVGAPAGGKRGVDANGAGAKPAAWLTCALEFDRQSGWHRERAEDWVRRHLGFRDLGRAFALEVPHRMAPDLATFLSDLLFNGSYCPADSAWTFPALARNQGRLVNGWHASVEFVAVPPPLVEAPPRRPAGPEGKPSGSHPEGGPSPYTRLAKGGAGLELDLADLRHRDRLPTELRADLPAQGLVNYLEAQAVVQALEALTATLAAPEAAPPCDPPTIAVLALYPTQAELIRRLARRLPRAGASGVEIEIDVPGAFRQREFSVVLLSLTRSHTHRAVAFGEGPHALALALTRARSKLLVFGDPGTLMRRSQWEGPLDHLDEAAAARERELVVQLVHYLQGQGPHPGVFRLREGSSL